MMGENNLMADAVFEGGGVKGIGLVGSGWCHRCCLASRWLHCCRDERDNGRIRL